jgi:ferritin
MLIYKYMQNNDCPITLNAIAKPDKVYKKDMDVLKAVWSTRSTSPPRSTPSMTLPTR